MKPYIRQKVKRAREVFLSRFDIELSMKMHNQLVGQITNGNAELVAHKDRNTALYRMTIRGQKMVVVYHKKDQYIVTALFDKEQTHTLAWECGFKCGLARQQTKNPHPEDTQEYWEFEHGRIAGRNRSIESANMPSAKEYKETHGKIPYGTILLLCDDTYIFSERSNGFVVTGRTSGNSDKGIDLRQRGARVAGRCSDINTWLRYGSIFPLEEV